MSASGESGARGVSTLAVHGSDDAPVRPVSATVVGPVHRSTTYPLDDAGFDDVVRTGGQGTWYYGRLANPTTARVAATIAALEGAPTGELFASGMAAIGTTLTALVPPGGRLVAAAELYGDTRALLDGEWAAAGRRVAYAPVADHAALARALEAGADALLVEALSNPMLRVADLPRLATTARANGAIAIVDATFASPVNVRPYEHGFDVVLHSATKYLNGHTDVVAGVVCGREDLMARLRPLAALRGATLDPGAAYLLERGLKTLAVRMERHNANGLAVASWLRGRPDVAAVAHPLLDDHPDHAVALRLLAGGSAMVTATLAGDADRGRRMLGELRLIAHAASLGGVESIACLPAATSHAAVPEAERRRQGIEQSTIRLSLGIEDAEDLIDDLRRALDRSTSAAPPGERCAPS